MTGADDYLRKLFLAVLAARRDVAAAGRVGEYAARGQDDLTPERGGSGGGADVSMTWSRFDRWPSCALSAWTGGDQAGDLRRGVDDEFMIPTSSRSMAARLRRKLDTAGDGSPRSRARRASTPVHCRDCPAAAADEPVTCVTAVRPRCSSTAASGYLVFTLASA